MSAAFPPQQPSSARPWWSRSSSSKSIHSDKQPSASTSAKPPAAKKLNNLATAIGLKPRKTALAIQEPPSPVLPLHTHDIDDSKYRTRLSAKSVQSWDEMLEPVTPSDPTRDHHNYTQSVMTMSEDPFAARMILVPKIPADPTRLSVFSDTSTSDSHSRRADPGPDYNRMSFASSSSHSHQRSDFPPDSSVASPTSLLHSNAAGGRRISRLTVQSDKPMRRMSNFLSAQSTPTSPAPTEYSDPGRRIHTSASSTTLKDKRRAAEPVVPSLPRPTTRPRGMTDVGPARRDLMSSSDNTRLLPSAFPPPTPATSNSTQPRVVVRQASLTRIQPPSAPPTSGLPPPPLVTGSSSTKSSLRLQPPSPSSASSSSLSFASSLSSRDAVHSSVSHHSDRHNIKEKKRFSNERYMSEHGKERGRDKHAAPRNDANGPSSSRHHREPSSPRTVKKAASQQTLSKHFPGMGAASTSSIATEDGKVLKKQRSFHTSRIPMPPLPAPFRHVNSFLPQGTSAREEPPLTKEQRRGSTQSTSGHTNQPAVRKRLFSGTSLRRSSSSQAHSTTDDDAHSVFSLPIQDESPSFVNPFHSSDHVTSSFWDEATDPITSPPTSPNRDYYAQQIMSPAEMLRLEALVQKGGPDADIGRPRVNSFASASTSMSNPLSDVVSVDIPLRPASPSQNGDDGGKRAGSSSVGPGLQTKTRTPSLISRMLGAPSVLTGRPATARGNMSPPGSPTRSSSIQVKGTSGLSPPPRRARPSTSTGLHDNGNNPGNRMSVVPVFPLSPPPARRNTRRALNVEQVLQRRSIMKKPSFLEIDDEAERYRPPPQTEDSFLDMGKGSFDTVRSTDEEFGPA